MLPHVAARAQSLQDDFYTQSKPYFAAEEAYHRMLALRGEGTGASDIALVFSLMQTLEPQGIVREGEQEMARSAVGGLDRLRGLWNRLMTGETLTPQLRQQYQRLATMLYNSSVGLHRGRMSAFTQRARVMGVPPDLVIRGPADITGEKQYVDPSLVTPLR